MIDPFKARFPWLGGDLQTLRNSLRPKAQAARPAHGTVLVFDAANGTDRLSGLLDKPERDIGAPLAIIVHGLTGDAEGALTTTTAQAFLAQGWRTLRMNLRGAASNAPFCATTYHSGLSADLAAVIAQLPPDLTGNGLALIGFSAGGNQVLKLLGEQAEGPLVRAAVSICAPVSLIDAVHRLMAPRNLLYQRYLLRGLSDALARSQADPVFRRAGRRARTLFDYDATVTAPMHGYADALDYYVKAASLPVLNRIRTPALVLTAADDPWIPVATYRGIDWSACPALTPVIAPGGGHCGFHGRDSAQPWHDRLALDWLAERVSLPRG